MKRKFFLLLLSILFLPHIGNHLLVHAQTTLQGDANGDGKVNGVDYVVWLTHFNQNVTGPTNGDFNSSGKVDGVDYVLWLTNYGKTATSNSLTSYFPFGMFEDGNQWKGTAAEPAFQADLDRLKANNMDDIVLTNYTPNINIFDSKNVKVIAAPMDVLNTQWWKNTTITESETTAQSIAQPIVDSLKNHQSLVAYNLVDDAAGYTVNKLGLMTDAFNDVDASHPALVMAPGIDRFVQVPAPIYLSYLYPAKTTNAQCDFSSKGIMGRYVNNFAQALEIDRDTLQLTEKNIPYWFILQSHGTSPNTDPTITNVNNLRTPSVPEMRLQNWIAIAQGVRGIYWFIYRTQQFWTGLKDNLPLFNEVSDLARRTNALSPILLTLKNYDQQLFAANTGTALSLPNQPITATLTNATQTKWYVVAVNHSCSDQMINITSGFTTGQLKDTETGTTYNLGQQISFRAGDGKLFEVVGNVTKPPITPTTNMIKNGSFELGGTTATDWANISGWSRDTTTAHSGQASLKITGPIPSSYSLAPISGSLKPYTKYTLSFWVKTQNVSTFPNKGISMRYVHVSPSVGLALPPLTTTWVNGTSNWKQVFREFYTFAGVTQSRVDLQFNVADGGTAWVDDIVLCEGRLNCTSVNPSPISQQLSSTPSPGIATASIPRDEPNYTEDVESWWATHPFNPESSTYIPVGGIPSPAPVINVKQQYGGNIKAAIDALPSTGGTLFFDPGEYANNISIIGRQNIHFISNGGAVIKGPAVNPPIVGVGFHTNTSEITIAGCQAAISYDGFISALNNVNDVNHLSAVDCLKNTKGGFYFKNLTFDGGGTAFIGLRLAAVADIVFDKVTFQNFADAQQYHPGFVVGHEGIDNLWFRESVFKGPNRYAVYVDGLHGGGILNSTFEGYFGSGSLLFLTNDDYTWDLNKNGTFEGSEQRIGNYIVVSGNRFGGTAQGIAATTANTLIKNNTVTSFMNQFAFFDVRNSNHGALYQFYGNKLIGNNTQDLFNLYKLRSSSACTSQQVCAKAGKYTVKDNITQNANRVQQYILTDPTYTAIDGPNLVSNNCINGVCN